MVSGSLPLRVGLSAGRARPGGAPRPFPVARRIELRPSKYDTTVSYTAQSSAGRSAPPYCPASRSREVSTIRDTDPSAKVRKLRDPYTSCCAQVGLEPVTDVVAWVVQWTINVCLQMGQFQKVCQHSPADPRCSSRNVSSSSYRPKVHDIICEEHLSPPEKPPHECGVEAFPPVRGSSRFVRTPFHRFRPAARMVRRTFRRPRR
jgi:hypothetical protein